MKRQPKKQAVSAVLAPAGRQISGSEYGRLLAEIKERVRSAQYEALRAVTESS